MAIGKYQEWLEPDNLIKLKGWARNGLTDEQIAHNMEISAKTLYEWKNKYSEIRESLKKGKEVIDLEVENALLKRALGYEYEEVTKENILNPKTGEYGLTVTKVVKKQVVPDTTAQIFWLKNRKPKDWKDKQFVEADEEALKKLDAVLGKIGGAGLET